MSELELRNAFRELAGAVKPAPEPYARLMARSRRRRFSRWVTGCAAAVAAVVLAPVALNAANDPGPDLGMIDSSVLLITPWTRKLIDAPVRGGLAGDAAFLRDVTKVLGGVKSGPMYGYPTKVLFAEDVGDKRVVVAVRHTKTHQVGVIMAGPRGAEAQLFADRDRREDYVKSLNPFTAVEFGFGIAENLRHIGIGLAPPGCQVAVATRDSEAPQWKTSGKGDYVVWSQSIADQLVRVTCAGATRYSGALLDMNNMVQVTGDLELLRSQVKAGSGRFEVPSMVMETMLNLTYPPQATGPLRVLYGGNVPGMADPVYVSAHPVDKGRWFVQTHVGASTGLMMTTADVTAVDAVVALDNPGNGTPDGVLVVAPPSAVKVEMRDASSGALVKSVPLSSGVSTVAHRAAEDVILRAFDANGMLVGTGVFPLPRSTVTPEWEMPQTAENWSSGA